MMIEQKKRLLLNFVYHPNVGHTVEHLKLARDFF